MNRLYNVFSSFDIPKEPSGSTKSRKGNPTGQSICVHLNQRPAGQSRAIAHAWTRMERVFFILTVWPSKIEMKKHALHASPGDVA